MGLARRAKSHKLATNRFEAVPAHVWKDPCALRSHQCHMPGVDLTRVPNHAEDLAGSPLPACAVDAKHLEAAVNEIVDDMRCGACAPTISQTVQVLDLGDGKKAAVIVTITTVQDQFL